MLLLIYLVQGALLIERPGAVANPFYLMVPSWTLYPLLLLATSATVIASQTGPARAGRPDEGFNRRHAARAGCAARRGPAAGQELLHGACPLRVHGTPGRAEGAGGLPEIRPGDRSHGGLLLPFARNALVSSRPGLPPWRTKIFIAMSATALDATSFFCLPPVRVVEMGTQIEL